MTQYVEIQDKENPRCPDPENIAQELDKKILQIEETQNVKLVTFTFIGEKDLVYQDEDSLFQYAVPHDKVYTFMLYFR